MLRLLDKAFPNKLIRIGNRIIDDYRLRAFDVAAHVKSRPRIKLFSDRKYSLDLPFQDPSLDLRVSVCARHPVDRLLSLYHDSRTRSLLVPQALAMSIPQFVEWACSEGIRDCRFLSQCTFLGAAATPDEGLSAVTRVLHEQEGRLRIFPSERLYEAVAASNRIAFFGEAGERDAFKRALQREAPRRATFSSTTLAPALKRLIEDAFAADFELWRMAGRQCHPLPKKKLDIVAAATSVAVFIKRHFFPRAAATLPMPTGAKWLFVHVPKTGGTTFQAILQKNFPDRFYDGNGPLDSLHPISPAEVDLMIRRAPCIDCFADHKFSIHLPEHTDGYDLRAITFVRDPVQLATSIYFFNRNVATLYPETKEKCLYEWLEWCLKEGHPPRIANDQSQRLLGGMQVNQYPERARECFNVAFEDPRIMIFPLARFDDALAYLQATFPDAFRDCSYERKNVSPRNEEVSEPAAELIREHSRLDYWLLERADAHLDKRLAELDVRRSVSP